MHVLEPRQPGLAIVRRSRCVPEGVAVDVHMAETNLGSEPTHLA